ncbi:MAG: hypothetical protein IPM26_13695 [Saprospiraceae bacterium]|nr:hypothetical protein [Saprospiraceae bacterium]
MLRLPHHRKAPNRCRNASPLSAIFALPKCVSAFGNIARMRLLQRTDKPAKGQTSPTKDRQARQRADKPAECFCKWTMSAERRRRIAET